MEKRTSYFMILGSIGMSIILLGIGLLLGHSLYEPKPVVLYAKEEQGNSINISQPEHTLTVIGQAKINVKPEIALISLGIEICDIEAEDANSEVNNRLESVISGLQGIGLNKSEIVPTNFTLYPRYEYIASENQLMGFCATNRIQVTTSKLDKISEILDKAIESGATNIYGVNFTSRNIEEITKKGIELAYQDAENQAKTLVKIMDATIQGMVSSKIEMSGYLLDNFIGYSGGGGGVEPQEGKLSIKVIIVYIVLK